MNAVAAANSVAVRRCNLRDIRSKHKELLLGDKRLRLHNVSEYVHDVTLAEFKKLLLNLKQKVVPLELLRKVKNSCVSNEYIEAFFRSEGAFNSLIRILIGSDAQKQLEAVACLTNVVCGPHKCSYKVAKASGAYLISFIDGSSHFLQEQSSWALANIANDCLECFHMIKAQGVLPALLKALESPSPSVQQSVIFALNACSKYDDPEVISAIQSGLQECLLSIVEQDSCNKSLFLDAAFTLSNCCFLSAKYALDLFGLKDVERIINILQNVIQKAEKDIFLATPLIRCVGFLSYNSKICKFLALHPEFFGSIQVLISEKDYTHLGKEAIWVLSNVVASTDISCNPLFFMPVIDSLKVILKLDCSVTLQVLYCLSVLVTKHESVRLQLKQHTIFVEIIFLSEREESLVTKAAITLLKIVNHQ